MSEEKETHEPQTMGLAFKQMREAQRGLLLSGVLERAEALTKARNKLYDDGAPSWEQIQTDILFNVQALLTFLVERSP